MTDRLPSDEWIEAANCLATVAQQLSSAAHEANNLLQVIAGSAEMIQLNASLPDTVLKRAGTIAEHSHRVSILLGSVRELAKFAPARPGQTTNLKAVIDSVLDLRRHALTRNRVAVAVQPHAAAPMAAVGWRPAMQMLLDLLLNAEQAVVGRPGAAVTIRTDRNGPDICVSVGDNGAGLPAPLPPLFTACEMPDDAPRLGIGLSAVRWMADRAGGRFEIESNAQGTTATLRLPAA